MVAARFEGYVLHLRLRLDLYIYRSAPQGRDACPASCTCLGNYLLHHDSFVQKQSHHGVTSTDKQLKKKRPLG